MGTLWRLWHLLAFLCLLVTGANGAQKRDPAIPSSGSWGPRTDYLAGCDFNNNSQPFCDWTQARGTGQGTWIRTKHATPTPTPRTGPEGDYPDGRGYFISQEARSLVPLDTSRLESPELVVSGGLCIDFWYHLLSQEDQNELKVLLLEEGRESKVWSRRGNRSSAWLYGFTFAYFWRETHVKVAFEAVRGLTEYSGTAVDNVAVRRGPCTASSSSSTPRVSTTPTTLPGEAIPCPANSDYNLCASACPATCSDPLAPQNCSKPCVEDCECREGFVLSGGRCVSVEDCGCLEDGQHYEKEETFWTRDCVSRCRCVGNGTLNCSAETCREGQICKEQNGIWGCSLPYTAHCHIHGDPHYVTFDGRLYHFQGGCNYTAVETCTDASPHFSVTTRNEYRWSTSWTALSSVAISFQNLHIALRKNREVYVNGVRATIPVNLPLGIEVEERPPYVVVRSPFGFLVRFDGDQELFVQVDERYKGHLCGLCGTYSGSQLDDFQRPDGVLEQDPDAFGNSWRVTDDHWTCAPPGPPAPPCNSTQELAFQERCKVILSSRGPFAACHRSIPSQLYFESCVYDQCATQGHEGQLCNSLGAYAAACQLCGVHLGAWWKDTECDASSSTSTPTASTTPTGLPVEDASSSTSIPTASTTPTGLPMEAPSTFPTEPSTPFIATPEPGAPTTCDFSCSFDVNFCLWTQSDSDNFDWTRHRGPTPSLTTGPSYDHTTGGGYFIYLKGTNANPGDVAYLVSPTCFSHGPHCFHFWYHMYGVAQTMALRVYVVVGGMAPALLWSQTGNQGDRWRKAEVSVPHRGRVQILLEGVRGEDFRSDLAVDDISMTSGCSETPPPGSTTPGTTLATTTPVPVTWGSCMVSGDPHYSTFDKQTHHFMGSCTYTLSRLCGQNTSLPFFNVEAANEHSEANTRVSYVQSVAIDVHGVRIMLVRGGAVKVNGEREVVPSTPTPGVQISSSGSYTVVSADFGLRVKFDGDHQVEVMLPSPYRDRVCGLCGNYNGDPRDDFLNPDGELESDSTSLGNSWQVSSHTSGSSGSGSDVLCTEEEKQVSQSSLSCGLITDAAGPFRDCHDTLDPTDHFTSCLYEQCELRLDPGALCQSLQSYADACWSLGARIKPWRNDTFCCES